MLRLVAVVCASVAFLGLALGLAAAKPGEPVPPLMKPPSLDAAWARQLKVKAVPVPASELAQTIEQVTSSTAIKRMTPEQKGLALKVPSAEVKGPIVLSARTPYHDDSNYIDFFPAQGDVLVRSQANYAYLSPGVNASPGFRPQVKLHLSTEPGRRYLLECAVDSASQATITAAAVSSDGLKMTTTVAPDDKTSLLLRFEPAAAAQKIYVELSSDKGWSYWGCEISWTGP